jgi:hypothetical protein
MHAVTAYRRFRSPGLVLVSVAGLALFGCGSSSPKISSPSTATATTASAATTAGLTTAATTTTGAPTTTVAPITTAAPTTTGAETSASTDESATTNAPPAPAPRNADGSVTVKVSVGTDDFETTGGKRVVGITKGTQVTLELTDPAIAEEYHLHGYDIEVSARKGQAGKMSFTADDTGQFDLESHVTEKVLLVLFVS